MAREPRWLAAVPAQQPEDGYSRIARLGFAVLATSIGVLQLILDHGRCLDWFSAREIVIEAILAGRRFYLYNRPSLCAKEPRLSFVPKQQCSLFGTTPVFQQDFPHYRTGR